MSSSGPKKSGKVVIKEYQSDAFCRQLGPLVAKLAEDAPDARYDARALGLMVAQILQFQEDALGVNSLKPREFPKLPLALLEDARADGGALALVAARLAAIKRADPNLKGFDWANPGSRRFNLENLAIVRAELQRAGLLPTPVVAAHPSCGDDARGKALEAARNLKATVVDDPADPSVTHVLYPDGALCVPEGEPSAQMRTLAANGPRARVHWRFLPPSYAEWLPAKSAPPPGAERSEPIDGKLPWRVTVRWALDSEQYNEWMHPQDYEADEDKAKSVAEAEAAAALGKATAAAEAGKRSAAAHLEAVQAVPAKRPLSDVEVDAADPGQEVAPGVFKRRVLNVHRPVLEGTMAVENVSQGQLDHSALVPLVEPLPLDQQQQPQQQQQQQQRDGGSQDMDVDAADDERYLMPMCATWFNMHTVHSHERRALPELTNGSNIATYVKMRNSLVTMYRQQPQRRLSVEEAHAKMKDCDADAVQHVHELMEHWGIINWLAVRPDPVPSAAVLPAGTHVGVSAVPEVPLGYSSYLNGHLGLQRRVQGGGEASSLLSLQMPSIADGIAAASVGGTLNTNLREPRFGRGGESSVSLAAGPRKFFCSAMPYVDCTALRYHCTKVPGVDLCPEAFANGIFPPGISAADFVKLEGGSDPPQPEIAPGAGKWTPQETLLLLEGLALYGSEWGPVAEHVGTHSLLECITYFLAMPIEDDMLDEIERRGVAAPGRGGASSTGQLDSIVQPDATGAPQNIGQVPFLGEPGINPLGAIMTSLSVLLGPRIASDAAQAAIRALASDDPTALAAAIEAARRGVDQHPVSTDAAALDGGANGEGTPAAPPTPPDPSRPLSDADLRAAAVVALAAAAERAKCMAKEQEYEMERCVRQVLRAQVDRVGIKLKYLQKIDEVLDQETSKQEEMLEKTVVVAR